MIFYLIGIDYNAASLQTREAACKRRKDIYDFLKVRQPKTAILYTCNRVEIYGTAENAFGLLGFLKELRKEFFDLFERAYVKQTSKGAVYHALALACGLKSQLIGERQIFRQLNSWLDQENFPEQLKRVWIEVLVEAENIRKESALYKKEANIAELVAKDLIKRLGLKKRLKLVVVGTGKIAQLFAKVSLAKVELYFASRKKHQRARQLAKLSGGEAILLKDLDSFLLDADALVSATSSPHYVISKRLLREVGSKKKNIFYVYDLAVPRDIEPTAKNIGRIFLQNLNDLESVFIKHNKSVGVLVSKTEKRVEKAAANIELKINKYENKSRYAPQPACL